MTNEDWWAPGVPAGASEMEQNLRDFVASHPEGWSHEEWLGLLSELRAQGVDVANTDAVGLALENERLAWTLRDKNVPGLGPKRIEAIVEHFGTLWHLSHADVASVAAIKTVPEGVAEAVVAALR